MLEKNAFKNDLKIKNLKSWFNYKRKFNIENPRYFRADGLLIFCGPQGSGKTLSAVKYVCELMKLYPTSKLVTNINITDYPIVTFDDYISKFTYSVSKAYSDKTLSQDTIDFLHQDYKLINRVFPFNNQDDLIEYENLQEGVIFLIDEIQLYLNSLESKNVNMEVMTEISQQRKQRKHIVATSQVFGRMAKPLREQFSSVVVCKNYMGFLQKNMLINRDSLDDNQDDMHITGKAEAKQWFFHSPKLYKMYDTYYKIEKNRFISAEKKKGHIYENSLKLKEDLK